MPLVLLPIVSSGRMGRYKRQGRSKRMYGSGHVGKPTHLMLSKGASAIAILACWGWSRVSPLPRRWWPREQRSPTDAARRGRGGRCGRYRSRQLALLMSTSMYSSMWRRHGDDNEEVDVTLLWSKRRSYIYMQLLLIVVLVSLSLMLYYGKNGQRWQASFARSYCRGSLAGTLFVFFLGRGALDK